MFSFIVDSDHIRKNISFKMSSGPHIEEIHSHRSIPSKRSTSSYVDSFSNVTLRGTKIEGVVITSSESTTMDKSPKSSEEKSISSSSAWFIPKHLSRRSREPRKICPMCTLSHSSDKCRRCAKHDSELSQQEKIKTHEPERSCAYRRCLFLLFELHQLL